MNLKIKPLKLECSFGFAGMCCCNCENQIEIYKHPSNGKQVTNGWLEDKSKIDKGSINDQLAWGCEAFRRLEDDPENKFKVIYMDAEHGMCEMWEPRTFTKSKLNQNEK